MSLDLNSNLGQVLVQVVSQIESVDNIYLAEFWGRVNGSLAEAGHQ